MLSILIDENFNHQILRGIRLRIENLDFVAAQSAGLEGTDDATLLAWAAEKRRILLTHDRQTVPRFAYERIRSQQVRSCEIFGKTHSPPRHQGTKEGKGRTR